MFPLLLSALSCTDEPKTSAEGGAQVSPFVGDFAALVTVTVEQELPVIGQMPASTQMSKLFRVREEGGVLTLEERVCRLSLSSDAPAKPVMDEALVSLFPVTLSPLEVTREEAGWRWRRARAGVVLGAELSEPHTEALPISSDDPRVSDLDRDEHPGVTLKITGIIEGELHAVLRYSDELEGTLADEERLWRGRSKDFTEQSILGASHELLMTPIPSVQVDDPTLNMVQVIPLADSEEPSCERVLEVLERELGVPYERPQHALDAPFGLLCDGTPAQVYDQQLLERVDCATGESFTLPSPRVELEPQLPSPYEVERCGLLSDELSVSEVLSCAELEFWQAFSDGRLAARQEALAYISEALDEVERRGYPEELNQEVAHLYMLRGMFYMAMGQENGVGEYLIGSREYSTPDFDRVAELDPDNFAVISFDLTLEMTLAGIAGDHMRAHSMAREALEYALSLGEPNTVEPANVGTILGLTGVTMTWPLSSGLPQESLEALEWVGCPDEIPFCRDNTLHAPYARPGLAYHQAEMYARLDMGEAYRAQLEVVAAQPRYETWPWRDLVELQRANPELLLEKFRSYGQDEYAHSYATMSSGCVMCHGR